MVTLFALILLISLKLIISTESKKYIQTCQLMDKHEYNSAYDLFSSYAENNSNSPNNKLALYNSARAARLAGLQNAGDSYMLVAEAYPNDFIAQLALFWAARAYEALGDNSTALEIHSQIVRNDSIPIPLSIYSLGRYGDHMYSLSAFSLAESLYIRSVTLSDTIRENLFSKYPFVEKLYIPELKYNQAKYSYRIATIQISRTNFLSMTPESILQIVQIKAEIEVWLAKCISFNVSEYLIPACGKAADLHLAFANGVASMEPTESLTIEEEEEFYNQLYIQFFEPETQKAINILIYAIENALSDNLITDAEKELINQFAEQIDLLAPGTIYTLAIPDSVYSISINHGPFSREMQLIGVEVNNSNIMSFLEEKSKRISLPIWAR